MSIFVARLSRLPPKFLEGCNEIQKVQVLRNEPWSFHDFQQGTDVCKNIQDIGKTQEKDCTGSDQRVQHLSSVEKEHTTFLLKIGKVFIHLWNPWNALCITCI